MGYAIVGMVTLLHEILEEEYRGRAFATIQVIMRASIFLSIMIAGPLADLITVLGRRLGIDPISLGLIRIGGSFKGTIDGTTVNFQYLLNGPQIILFTGGIVILSAGLFGHRAFHRYFGWNIHDKILMSRNRGAGETAWDPEDDACRPEEDASGGSAAPGEAGRERGEAAEAVPDEMRRLLETGMALEQELGGKPEDAPDPGERGRGGGDEGGIPGDEDE